METQFALGKVEAASRRLSSWVKRRDAASTFRAFTAQDIGRHESPVLREGVWPGYLVAESDATRTGRNLRPLSFIIFSRNDFCRICPNLTPLFGCQPEDKIRRKTILVPLDLFIEPLGRHAVNRGQIGIENDRNITNVTDGNFHRDHDMQRVRQELRRVVSFSGLKSGPSGIRTQDLAIKSRML